MGMICDAIRIVLTAFNYSYVGIPCAINFSMFRYTYHTGVAAGFEEFHGTFEKRDEKFKRVEIIAYKQFVILKSFSFFKENHSRGTSTFFPDAAWAIGTCR